MPFVLKAGKALNDKKAEIRIQLRPTPHYVFGGEPEAMRNEVGGSVGGLVGVRRLSTGCLGCLIAGVVRAEHAGGVLCPWVCPCTFACVCSGCLKALGPCPCAHSCMCSWWCACSPMRPSI